MKVKLKRKRDKDSETIEITGDFIRLDDLLKYAALVGTGGEAKVLIQSGAVLLNGDVCTQRGKKIYPGDVVKLDKREIVVSRAGAGNL